jgi:hypothetical protein
MLVVQEYYFPEGGPLKNNAYTLNYTVSPGEINFYSNCCNSHKFNKCEVCSGVRFYNNISGRQRTWRTLSTTQLLQN